MWSIARGDDVTDKYSRARACIPLVLFPQHVALNYITKLIHNSGYEQAIVLPVYVPNLIAETQVIQFC